MLTSNKHKIAEYTALGLPFTVAQGDDLPEVVADPVTIVKYKALAAGSKAIVEDTILEVDGEEIIDIKWRVQELSNIDKPVNIDWVVTIGFNTGTHIEISQHRTHCSLKHGVVYDDIPSDAIAFDPFLIPDGVDKTFYELYKLGLKSKYSPRTQAADKLMKGEPDFIFNNDEILPWVGDFQ